MILHPFIGSADFIGLNFTLTADLWWTGNILKADYILKGPWQNVRHLKPCPAAHERALHLWKTTCFEWFLKPLSGEAYWEANFSSDGNWNLYFLDGYRKNLIEEARVLTVQLQSEIVDDQWRLQTEVDLTSLNFSPGTRFLSHLSAVIETVDNKKSYWSLSHTQPQPDFHHPDHFSLEIQKEF